MECRLRKLARPGVVAGLSGGARDLVEGVHPLGQVMKVLAVAIPLQAFVDGLLGTTLR